MRVLLFTGGGGVKQFQLWKTIVIAQCIAEIDINGAYECFVEIGKTKTLPTI